MIIHSQGIADAIELCYDEKIEGHEIICSLLKVLQQKMDEVIVENKTESSQEYIRGFIYGLGAFLHKKF
jgi:hypothetical protein